jgi:hypothetical protein
VQALCSTVSAIVRFWQHSFSNCDDAQMLTVSGRMTPDHHWKFLRMFARRLSLAAVAVFAFAVLPTRPIAAQTPVLSFSLDGGFTDGFTGTLGWQFTANSTVDLTAFGFYNNGGPITTSHEVGLWDLGGNLLASGTVGPTGTGTTIDFFDYSPTTPFTLQAGTSYVIGTALTRSDFFYYDPSSITTVPGISFVQSQFDTNGAAALSFPQTAGDQGSGFGYFGPNFQVSAVPEPGAIGYLVGMAAMGGAALWAKRRCRARAKPSQP